MSSIVTVTVSPDTSWLTPAGVPVNITSPGSKVIMCEIQETISRALLTKSLVFPSCFVVPLTWHEISKFSGSNSVSIHGPSGQNVSKLFERVHCKSLFCRSLAVTSFAQVYPKITSSARSTSTFLANAPIIIAYSAS